MKRMKRNGCKLPKKPLRLVLPNEKLPGVFDTIWDAKVGSDLKRLVPNEDYGRCRQLLAQFGYDANAWVRDVES